MPTPLRHLPVIQNWDCHGCSHCCREYAVAVTPEERRRIEGQDWSADPEVAGRPLFEKAGWWSSDVHLAHRKEGGCVFLSRDNRCKIHERYGADAKPLACRLFPFYFVPAGDHWRVGVRYACPSAADNNGRPLEAQAAEVRGYLKQFEQRHGEAISDLPPPPLQQGQAMTWGDLARVARVMDKIFARPDGAVGWKLRQCLALASLCRQATFDNVTGGRLDEFLDLLLPVIEEETPQDPARVEPPGWLGRVLFRQMAAMYARKDRGEYHGVSRRGRLALFVAGCRFAAGSGRVPRMNSLIGTTTFAALEQPAGPLPPPAEEVLHRYYRMKLQSLQFFGPTNFSLPFWGGLDSLALTYPVILWLTRAIPGPRVESLKLAVSVVDDHFGYNPILRQGRYRRIPRMLSSRGELPRLVAWYSR